LGDAHLARLLPYEAYPQERSLKLGPYAEGRGQCNGVASGIECLLSQISSRVTTPVVLGMSNENYELKYLQEGFQLEAKSPAAEAGAVESVAHRENSLEGVNRSHAYEALRT
jgi:hypothetical protein